MNDLQTETFKHMNDTLAQVVSHTLWAKLHAEKGNIESMRGALEAAALTARLLAELADIAAGEVEI